MATVTQDAQEPARLDLVVPRDRHYEVSLEFEDDAGNPIDVSADTFAAEVRRDPGSDVEFSFTVTNSGFGKTNEILLSVEPTDTASADPAPHAWDLKKTDGTSGDEVSLLRGTVYVQSEVTD